MTIWIYELDILWVFIGLAGIFHGKLIWGVGVQFHCNSFGFRLGMGGIPVPFPVESGIPHWECLLPRIWNSTGFSMESEKERLSGLYETESETTG